MASSLRVEHINPFIKATVETFRSMVRTEVMPLRPLLKRDAKLRADVSGIIGLSGGAKGTVVLTFPRITALKTVTEFGGEKVVILDEAVIDAIGELANIIAGAAKGELSQFKINISLPTVVLGEDHELGGPKDIVPMIVPFESKLGSFNLIVSFKSES